MSTIDDKLRQHYRERELDDAGVDRILAAARAGESAEGATAAGPGAASRRDLDSNAPADPPRRSPSRFWLVAAAILLPLLAGLVFMLRPVSDQVGPIVKEVAYNYAKGSPSDIRSDRYEVVQAGLDRLDFSILPLRDRVLRDFELLGGRYCSIQDELAAQLAMTRKDTGEPYLLYVVPAEGDLAQVPEGSSIKDDLQVELWRDDGRLFVLAGPAASGS